MTRQKKFASLFHHIFITIWQKKILWSSLALKDSYTTILFNKWSQSDKNVMRMWWLQISTYFLVHIIWKFPPLQNLMSDARCLDVDACLSAPNVVISTVHKKPGRKKFLHCVSKTFDFCFYTLGPLSIKWYEKENHLSTAFWDMATLNAKFWEPWKIKFKFIGF